jgi:short-subunit dehydrogenase
MIKGKQAALALAAMGAGGWLIRRLTRPRRIDLYGKKVLVTGGSRGLGLVLARQLATEGADLIICARDRDELDRASAELSQRGAPVLALTCDLTDDAQVQRMINLVQQRWGGIDVLINNAGIITVGPLETMTLEDFQEVMAANFWSAVHTILAVLPGMKERGEGRIVNITSIGGHISVPHLLPYDASKFALVGLSEGLRAELRKDGIVVTTVVPGLMRTGSPRNAFFKGKNRAEFTWFNLGDALPLLSISAEHAARNIVRALKRGDAEVTLSLPAKIAARVHGLFPGLTCDVLSLVNLLLPGPGGIGTERARGAESQSLLSPSWLTILSERAAHRNNEIEHDGAKPINRIFPKMEK